MSQDAYARARAVMHALWEEPEGMTYVHEGMLVAADALEEAGLLNDAEWLRWSYRTDCGEAEGSEAPPPGPFVFICKTWQEIPERLDRQPGLAELIQLPTGGLDLFWLREAQAEQRKRMAAEREAVSSQEPPGTPED